MVSEVRFHVIVLIIAIAIIILFAFTYFAGPSEEVNTTTAAPPASTESKYGVRIIVVIDNYPHCSGLKTVWGLSIYAEVCGVKFLFDAGPDPDILKNNAKLLGINLSNLDFVVISHEHGDHRCGLPYVAKTCPGIKVYVPTSSKLLKEYVTDLGFRVVGVEKTIEVAPGIYVIGETYGPPYEVAVAVNTSRGIIVLVGCSHPGVSTILKKVINDVEGNIYAVVGGFHLSSAPENEIISVVDDLVSLGVKKVYPIHCSGDYIRNYLKTNYPDIYGDGGVGMELVFEN